MSSYRQHLYHVVFSTENLLFTINQENTFKGWSDGYGSFTCSYADIDRLIKYIKSQHNHHKKVTFEEEYRMVLLEAGIVPDEKFFP